MTTPKGGQGKKVAMLKKMLRDEFAKRDRIRKRLSAISLALTALSDENPPGGGPDVKSVIKQVDDIF